MNDRRTDHKKLCLLVMPFDEYGQTRLKAFVGVPQPNGEIHGTGSYRFDNGNEYDGLHITAYIDYNGIGQNDTRGVWGISHHYSDVRIETPEKARDIARVLTAIDRGLTKARETHGYLRDEDYAQYVFRVAAALKIPSVYFYGSKRYGEMHGSRYIKVTASDLQSHVVNLVDAIHNNRRHEYI